MLLPDSLASIISGVRTLDMMRLSVPHHIVGDDSSTQASAVLPCNHRCELTEVADSTSSGVITGHGQPKVITVSEHHAVHATGESNVRFEVAPWLKKPDIRAAGRSSLQATFQVRSMIIHMSRLCLVSR